MIKRILFPTDFSHAADNAFVYALRFAHRLGASLTTMHAYRIPYLKTERLPNTLKAVYESITIEEFEDYRDNIPHLRRIAEAQGLGNIPISHMMVEEKHSTIEAILHSAKEAESDLIIMGTTGASGLKKAILGSTASHILEDAHCPVLAVPHEAIFDGTLDTVAMTTEFTELDRAALLRVIEILQPLNPTVHCIHVDIAHTDPISHKMELFKQSFDGQSGIVFKVVDAISIEDALARYAENVNVDILAMLTHRRNFFQELFTYSMTKKMALHLRIPILAIQAHTLE